jgi:hypothetical protein
MLTAAVSRRLAVLRRPRSAARVARLLWIVWAIVVWNVLFDHTIVVAGRNYIAAANRAAFSTPPHYENIDVWMRPAVTHGLWLATIGAGILAASGLLLVRALSRLGQSGAKCA